MKFYNKYRLLVLLIVVLFISCKKSTFTELYPDPEKVSKGKIEALFTNLLTQSRYHMQYWDLVTFSSSTIGRYTQVFGYTNEQNKFLPSDSYVSDRWNKFYVDILPLYRQMEFLYNELPENEKSNYKYMMGLGYAVMANEMSKVTDLWGDVPFSEAGKIRATNDKVIYPKFDSQKEIYSSMIAELKTIATFMNETEAPTGAVAKTLSTYDLVNKGDITKWKKFVNSLRLRFLVRVKNTDIGTSATAEINSILSNPTAFPLIEDNADNTLLASGGPNLFAIDGQHEKGPVNGFSSAYAGKAMINVLSKSSDPRLKVIFGKNVNGDYAGLNAVALPSSVIEDSLNHRLYSMIDSAAFRYNNFLPCVFFTAAETQFLKAELSSGAAAETAFKEGIRQSIKWYYYVRNLNDKIESVNVGKLTPPTDAEIDVVVQYYVSNYYNNPAIGKDEAIGIQRWLHFGHLQMYEAFADQRRFNHPALPFLPDASATQGIPNRIKYPNRENVTNTLGMTQENKTNDNYTIKVWWDK